jgi:hypothetical protein
MHNPESKVTKALDHERRARLFALVQDRNETAVISALGISRSTLARALAGLALYPGTRLMIETRMVEIEAKEKAARSCL